MATVLLIDDDVDLVAVNQLVLKQRGHEVKVAHSAGQAREALKGPPPDVIVLDIMMETASIGFDLAQEIAAKFPNLPTIILSSVHRAKGKGFGFAPDEQWLPVAKFLDKPVDPAALADEVEALARGRS